MPSPSEAVRPPAATGPLPATLVVLIIVHALAAAAAGLLVSTLVFSAPDVAVHRPDWLEPTGRAVVAGALLFAAYGATTWLLARRRRAGLVVAALLAAAGLVAGVIGLQGPLLVNVAILVLVTRPSARHAVR